MIICFCLNNLGAFGLGATLTSLIRHCSDTEKLELHFFCALVDDNIKKSIASLLTETNYKGSFKFVDIDPATTFKNYRSLQGDYATYGRLLMPDIIGSGQFLYLDSDILVETDVLELSNANLNGNDIAAVKGSVLQHHLEQKFYINALGLNPGINGFNAGVLLINIDKWNLHQVKDKLFAVGDKYPNELLSADQTLLNACFAGDFFCLPAKYNVTWYAYQKPAVENNAIFHFVGSPKPWDVFGKYMHSGYERWRQYNSVIWQKNVLRKFRLQQIKRFWTIRRSYIRTFLKK